MRYRPLGRTGQYVSEICLGAMTFDGGAGFWRAIGTLDQAASTKLVARALEAGVNFIDTANVYSEGQSEVQVGQALRDLGVKREDVIIATKVRARMETLRSPTSQASSPGMCCMPLSWMRCGDPSAIRTRMAAKEAAKGPLVPLRQLTLRHFALASTASAGAES